MSQAENETLQARVEKLEAEVRSVAHYRDCVMQSKYEGWRVFEEKYM